MSAPVSLSPLPPLVDTAYAQTNSFLANLPSGQLSSIIAAASNKIRRYCRRDFNAANYTQYFDGGMYPFDVFYLLNIPIAQITRLATNPQTVLNIQNTSTSMYQRATVRTTALGIVLETVASGVPATISSVTWDAYPTVQTVANAINALGNGWLATPTIGYALNASADFPSNLGAFSTLCGPGAGLQQYLENPQFGGNGAWIYSIQQGSVLQGWRLDADKGIVWGAFPRGQQNIRCDWQGGFSQIPDAVQEACLLTAVAIWGAGRINPFLKSENSLDYGYTLADKARVIPPAAVSLLSEYVDHAAWLV